MQSGDDFRRQMWQKSSFLSIGRWGIPLIHKQDLIEGEINLIGYPDTKSHDRAGNTCRGVHFFVDDPRFEGIYKHPDRTFEKLFQYRFLLTPDFSVYAEMSPWMQLASVAKNRWVGAYWQSRGCIVYPTISWGTPQTYEFCFKGYERGGTVAIATYACKSAKLLFLQGYYEMLRQLDPEHIICLGKPFSEMKEVDIVVDPKSTRKAVR